MVTLIIWAISCDKPVVASDEDKVKNGQQVSPDTSGGSHMQKNETPLQEENQK